MVVRQHRRRGQPRRLLPFAAVLAGLVLLVSSLLHLAPTLDPWRQTEAASSAAGSSARDPQGFEPLGTAPDEYVLDGPAAGSPAREPLLAGRSPRGPAVAPAGKGRAASGRGATDDEVAEPVSVAIPAVDVQSRLIRLGLNADRTLQVPRSYSSAGWYAGGAAPGEVGPAVVVGHYDSVDGPAVFYRLSQLQPGQAVHVRRADGSLAEFTVDRVKRFSKGAFPTQEVYGRVDRPELRLITCGGSFDESTRHYRDNVVVFAHLT